MSSQAEKVIQYYKATYFDYDVLWTGNNDLSVHFGYFDATVKNHRESMAKMNEVLADLSGITENDWVLDAGCGYGSSSIWLAKNRRARVAGINIVSFQVEKAKQNAIKFGVSDKVQFKAEDYNHTSFSDQSFDVVWALESVVHTESRLEFLREAHRLIKPNGRLMIAEYLLRDNPPLTTRELDYLKPWLDGWAMPHLATVPEYLSLFSEVGFQPHVIHDISENIRPSLQRSGKLVPIVPFAILSLPVVKVLSWMKLFNPGRVANMEGLVHQSKALDRNLWHYVVLVASKFER